MFSNPGKKIKTLSFVFLVLLLAGTIYISINYGSDRVVAQYTGEVVGHVFNAEKFFPVFIPGLVISYIFPLLTYGFGELIETTVEMKNTIKNLKDN